MPDPDIDLDVQKFFDSVRWDLLVRAVEAHTDAASALDHLASQADEVYLHIDNDAFDPATAPGVADEPVPGGLSLAQMEELIHAVTARLPIAAATTATYTPANDQQDRTLIANIRIIELLGEHAARN